MGWERQWLGSGKGRGVVSAEEGRGLGEGRGKKRGNRVSLRIKFGRS